MWSPPNYFEALILFLYGVVLFIMFVSQNKGEEESQTML